MRLLRTFAGAATAARLTVARVPMLRPRRKRPIVIVVAEIPDSVRTDDAADKDAVYGLGVRARGAASAPNDLAGVDPALEMRPPAEVLLVVPAGLCSRPRHRFTRAGAGDKTTMCREERIHSAICRESVVDDEEQAALVEWMVGNGITKRTDVVADPPPDEAPCAQDPASEH